MSPVGECAERAAAAGGRGEPGGGRVVVFVHRNRRRSDGRLLDLGGAGEQRGAAGERGLRLGRHDHRHADRALEHARDQRNPGATTENHHRLHRMLRADDDIAGHPGRRLDRQHHQRFEVLLREQNQALLAGQRHRIAVGQLLLGGPAQRVEGGEARGVGRMRDPARGDLLLPDQRIQVVAADVADPLALVHIAGAGVDHAHRETGTAEVVNGQGGHFAHIAGGVGEVHGGNGFGHELIVGELAPCHRGAHRPGLRLTAEGDGGGGDLRRRGQRGGDRVGGGLFGLLFGHRDRLQVERIRRNGTVWAAVLRTREAHRPGPHRNSQNRTHPLPISSVLHDMRGLR